MTEEEIHLRDYLKVISKHKALIFLFLIVTMIVVIFGTLSTTPQYMGTTSVMIEKAASNDLTSRYSYNAYDPEFYETQFQLIKSMEVSKRVVELLSLETTYDSYMGKSEKPGKIAQLKDIVKGFKSKLLAYLKPAPETDGEGSALEPLSRADILAAQINANISVSPVKESHIVSIQYASPNPEFAALVANTVAKAYMELTLDMKMEATRRTLAWMTEKAEEERQKLDAKEAELQKYMRSSDLVTLENRLAVIPQKLTEISTQLVRAQSKRQKLESLYKKVDQVANQPELAESILGVTNDNTLQTLRDQILKSEQNIRELATKYGAKHPVMIKAKGELETLNNKKESEIKRLISLVKNEYELALADERNLEKQFSQSKAEAQNLNEKFLQYNVYKREMETNRQLYDSLLIKLKEQTITGETQPVNLWIVEYANAPRAPFKPRTMVNLLLGFVVGLFGGIGLAFFVEYLDQTVKYPEETEQMLKQPILGVIPKLKDKGQNPDKAMLTMTRSGIAENFRSLRTSIMLSSSNQPPRKILVTSVNAGDGKSTTAFNLAVAIAQSGKQVLLIDCDLRKPRLHKILGTDSDKGLSTYLAGLSKTDILARNEIDNLTFIPAGPIPPNPSELLISDNMDYLFDQMLQKVDFIVCDSPPLQAVVDARILAQKCDGTVLVLRAKETTFDAARKSLKQLEDVNAPVLGLMLNGIELKKDDYYYESYYGSYSEKPQHS